jgi:NAD(P)-dependent dehydrogenase (short-subunit alcohol dehydrogenase family)
MAAQGTPGFSGVFSDKVVFVTGAARGQGRAHAVRFAEEGADVIAFDRCGQLDSVAYPMATEQDLDETVKLVSRSSAASTSCSPMGILPAAGHQGRDITANTGRPPSHRGGFTAGRGLTLK